MRSCTLVQRVLLVPVFALIVGGDCLRAQGGEEKEPTWDGKNAQQWMGILKSGNKEDRNKAAFALGFLQAKQSIPLLLETWVLDGDDRCLNALGRISLGAVADDAPLALLIQNGADAATVRKYVSERNTKYLRSAVVTGGSRIAEAVPRILKVMKDNKGPEVKERGISVIAAITRLRWTVPIDNPADLSGPKEGSVLVLGPFFLNADDPIFKTRAKLAEQTLPVLREALKEKNSSVRVLALVALGNLGSDAREVLPTIRELTDNPSQEIRKAAEKAVRKIEENRIGGD